MTPANYQRYARQQHVMVFEWVYLLNEKEPPLHWTEFKQRYVDRPDPNAPMFDQLRDSYKALKAGMDHELRYIPGPGWYGLRRIEPSELARWACDSRRVVVPPDSSPPYLFIRRKRQSSAYNG